jgi:hypothetical protein
VAPLRCGLVAVYAMPAATDVGLEDVQECALRLPSQVPHSRFGKGLEGTDAAAIIQQSRVNYASQNARIVI